jgi:hypothetical protein
MKTSLHVLALVFAAGIPASIAAGFAGIALPAALGVGPLALGFGLSLAAQLLLHDYATVARPLAVHTLTRREKSPLRLAA